MERKGCTGSFDVSNDASGLVVHEFDADLGYAAAGTWGWEVC